MNYSVVILLCCVLFCFSFVIVCIWRENRNLNFWLIESRWVSTLFVSSVCKLYKSPVFLISLIHKYHLDACISLFCIIRMKYLRQTTFIKKRGLFSSQFWSFKGMALSLAQLYGAPQSGWQKDRQENEILSSPKDLLLCPAS
jgi:hypothetical protein